MNARLFNMLHDRAYHHLAAVGHGINIHLNGLVQKSVQQDG